MGKLGEYHERQVTFMPVEVANIGGLFEFFFIVFSILYILFMQPFKDLDLSISFDKLMNKIDRTRGTFRSSIKLTREYESRVDCCFNLQLFLYKRLLPTCLTRKCS